MRVSAADGREWDVRRHVRWPEWRSLWDSDDRWWDGIQVLDVPSDDVGGVIAGIVAAIVLGILVTVLIIVLAPLIVFVFEAILVVIAAIALGRPWLVVASTLGPPAEERHWLVKGPFASRRAVREVADELRRGVIAEPETFEQEPLRH
jgi:hypothetical protein